MDLIFSGSGPDGRRRARQQNKERAPLPEAVLREDLVGPGRLEKGPDISGQVPDDPPTGEEVQHHGSSFVPLL